MCTNLNCNTLMNSILHSMTSMKSILSAFFLSLSVSAIQETRGVANQFIAAYGGDRVTRLNHKLVTLQVRLDAGSTPESNPEGARLEHITEATEGRYCASIQTQSVSGNAFAMYLTSQEPLDRGSEKWDEIDFEFVGRDPTNVWTNLFHDGSDVGQGQSIPLGFNPDQVQGRFCLKWKVGESVEFSINNQTVRTASLAGWTKPLHAVVSFWGVPLAGGQFDGFTGPQGLQPGSSITGTAARILLELGGQTGPSKITQF